MAVGTFVSPTRFRSEREGDGSSCHGPSDARSSEGASVHDHRWRRFFVVWSPPTRVLHDQPPTWDGKGPDNQVEPYLKLEDAAKAARHDHFAVFAKGPEVGGE